jgi:hypothetical protein
VQQHIRIAVTDRVPVMRDLDATDTKRSAVREAVSIVANANPLVRRLSSLSSVVSAAVASRCRVANSP